MVNKLPSSEVVGICSIPPENLRKTSLQSQRRRQLRRKRTVVAVAEAVTVEDSGRSSEEEAIVEEEDGGCVEERRMSGSRRRMLVVEDGGRRSRSGGGGGHGGGRRRRRMLRRLEGGCTGRRMQMGRTAVRRVEDREAESQRCVQESFEGFLLPGRWVSVQPGPSARYSAHWRARPE